MKQVELEVLWAKETRVSVARWAEPRPYRTCDRSFSEIYVSISDENHTVGHFRMDSFLSFYCHQLLRVSLICPNPNHEWAILFSSRSRKKRQIFLGCCFVFRAKRTNYHTSFWVSFYCHLNSNETKSINWEFSLEIHHYWRSRSSLWCLSPISTQITAFVWQKDPSLLWWICLYLEASYRLKLHERGFLK